MFKWVSPLYSSWCFLYMPSWEDFLTWLHRVTKEHAELNCYTDLPSCDDTTHVVYKVAFVKSRCVYYENWQPYWGDEYVMRIVFCDYSSVYKCVYKVCYDFTFSPPTKRTIFLYMRAEPPNCPIGEPQLPPPGKTWNEHWITNCFSKPCPPCPTFE